MVVYAKSYPRDNPETLKAHTETLLEELWRIRSIYGQQINKLIPESLREYFWDALEISCKAHDLGKIHTPFQNAIRRALKLRVLSSIDGIEEIPHNILSAAFIFDLVKKFPREIQDTVFQAVAFHHSRGTDNLSDEGWKNVVEVVERDLRQNLNRLREMQPLFDGSIPSPRSTYRKRLQSKPKGEYHTFFIFLKGLLHRIDHSASAHLEIETTPLIRCDQLITTHLQTKGVSDSDIWQKELAEKCRHTSVIFQASTGSGKTEFSLYWFGDEKGFYILPVRTSVNAMYERLKKTYQTENVGLLHSDSYFYAIEEYVFLTGIENQNTYGLEQSIVRMDLAKQMSMPITVSTADQLFTSVFKYHGYEKIYSTLAYSNLVVDEIQSYDPDMVATILKGLEDITKLGGKFCLITATLPNFYLDYLRQNISSLEVLPPRFGKYKKHRLHVVNDSIINDDAIKLILRLYQKYGKVLIIVNTVKRSQELYEIISQKNLPTFLLHAGFIYKDRRERESGDNGILKNPEGIWITTQLVEVSLDIDFPAMITELSTIDSQVQRWGRVWRHKKEDYNDNEPNIFVCSDASGIVDEKGRSLIYDKELVEISKHVLEKRNGSLLSQSDEYEIIQEVFSHPDFQHTKYFKKFNDSMFLIKNLDFNIETRYEAQKLFRKMANVSAIPLPVYQNNVDEIDKALDVLESKTDREEKIRALYTVRKFSLSMPIYKSKNITLQPLRKGLDIMIACIDYSEFTGVGKTSGVIL